MLYCSNNVRGSPDGNHERRACTLEAYVLRLAMDILAIVALVFVVLLILHRRKRRQEEQHRVRIKQEAILRLIEQVEVTDDDAALDELFSQFVFSYEADPDRWERARQKVAGARMRMEQALADEELGRLIARGEEGRSLEAYARELAGFGGHRLSDEGRQMLAAERVRVADMLAALLLEQARNGNAKALVALRSVVSVYGNSVLNDIYTRLTGTVYEFPSDWNELVSQLIDRPDVTWFYYQTIEVDAQRLANEAQRVVRPASGYLDAERLRRAQMILALIEASIKQLTVSEHGIVGDGMKMSTLYRQVVGDRMYFALLGVVDRLRPVAPVEL